MMIMKKKISLLITTKNRLEDLKITLQHLTSLLSKESVECLVYDDASTDGTFDYLKAYFPDLILFRNEKSLGLIHNRNVLLNNCSGDYAISLDDDAHFLSENVLENILDYFESNPKCGVIACRIFWGKTAPTSIVTKEVAQRVKGFVGCGHVWNMQAWREIPNYPEFKKGWEVHYVPELLVQHRVEVKTRKNDSDYAQRQRRSFRSGWYLYLLFYPWTIIPKKLAYTLWIQIKTKVFKGDSRATKGLVLALWDVFIHVPRLLKESNRFTLEEYKKYSNLEPTKIYWRPESED